MSISKTVVINCAGMGSRLGMGTTKALIEIEGKSLIEWQLEMLNDVNDVRVVVGFQADQVIEKVLLVRKDVIFVTNNNYKDTGTAASFALGAKHVKGLVVSLDGDLLVHPEDLKYFLSIDEEAVGYSRQLTSEPVYAEIKEIEGVKWVINFNRNGGKYEWTGLVQLDASKVDMTNHHVYQMLEDKLPFKAIEIRSCEIDTPADYDKAVDWVKRNLKKVGEVNG